MDDHVLEQLRDAEVPPVPDRLIEGIHNRVNRTLLVGHLFEFASQGLVHCMFHMTMAMWGALVVTVTGRFPKHPERKRKP